MSEFIQISDAIINKSEIVDINPNHTSGDKKLIKVKLKNNTYWTFGGDEKHMSEIMNYIKKELLKNSGYEKHLHHIRRMIGWKTGVTSKTDKELMRYIDSIL